ncbi:MAG TPA: NOL1/NOP2/sun family putative RNA methylase [Candidatus Nanoarchaeia archaeon]|nr:NOL1/NOP2/sun family putative RNA methylase [Candidatus Nanoarchaeia archaeon]
MADETLETIPDSSKFEVKEKFAEHYKQLLGSRYDEFIKYSTSYIRKSIRVNTLKIGVNELVKRLGKNWSLAQVAWCREGFWIDYKAEIAEEKRYDIGNTLEHQLGYIYVQDAASMIPPVVLEPKPGELVLDMCSAPGSKASQIAAMMENKGLLISNDTKGDRLKALGINLQRMGVSNVLITQMLGHRFRKASLRFDKVLVDAPCSGTGTIRRSLRTLTMWSPDLVRKMAADQKQLVASGFEALKPGGVMVYSTCTMEPEEDEGIVSWLLDNYKNARAEEIKLDIKRSPAILEFNGEKYNPEVAKCLRIWPQDNDSEGFFVARIKKL